jgi:hypothetical protein
MEELTIEHELMRPPPRQIRNRHGMRGVLKEFWWLLLPHTWIVVVATVVFAWLLHSYLVPEYRVQAHITERQVSENKNGQWISVAFAYTIEGREYTGFGSVEDDRYKQIEPGSKSTIPVDVFRNPINNEYIAHIPDPRFATFMFGCGAILITFWCCFIGALAYWTGRWSRLSRDLCRNGVPVVGKIADLRVKGLRRKCVVRFNYDARAEQDGTKVMQPFTNEIETSPQAYDQLKVGQAVTVLYDPQKPQRSIVYCCGDFVSGNW